MMNGLKLKKECYCCANATSSTYDNVYPFVCNPIYALLKNSSTIIYISSPFNSGLVQQAMHENCKGQKDHDKKNNLV